MSGPDPATHPEPSGDSDPGRHPEPGDDPEPALDEEAEREQEESLQRVQRGDIPIAAERRLRELAGRGGSFTSDLSVADFALCHQSGLRPLSQVMGSSIYQVGY